MIETRQDIVRTYHPTALSLIAAVVLMPLIMCITWPVAALLGDARILVVEFVGVPLFCLIGLGLTLQGHSFTFRTVDSSVQIQRRVLLVAAGEFIRVPFQTITELDWQDAGDGGDLTMTVAGAKRYYVTKSRSKARQIAQMVIQVQPNLIPNLHPHLV